MVTLSIAGYLIAPHVCQYDGSARLADMGCTPTSGAMGMNTVTGRRWDGDDVLDKVAKWEETDPKTPGWSLNDLDKAMARVGVGFEIRSGTGRTGVRSALANDLVVVMQGHSAYFGNTTCSGAFNGFHCLVVYPCRALINGVWHRWVGDPICKTGRWERESEIWQYGEGLNPRIQFGVFTKPVAKVVIKPPDTSTATHRAYFDRGAQVKVYRLNAAGRIIGPPYYTIKPWNNPDSSAPCTAPKRTLTADGKSAVVTVRVTKGYYVNNTIAVSSVGVDVKEG